MIPVFCYDKEAKMMTLRSWFVKVIGFAVLLSTLSGIASASITFEGWTQGDFFEGTTPLGSSIFRGVSYTPINFSTNGILLPFNELSVPSISD
jgi:hypothetical protein